VRAGPTSRSRCDHPDDPDRYLGRRLTDRVTADVLEALVDDGDDETRFKTVLRILQRDLVVHIVAGGE
jgi:hypothetical protein